MKYSDREALRLPGIRANLKNAAIWVLRVTLRSCKGLHIVGRRLAHKLMGGRTEAVDGYLVMLLIVKELSFDLATERRLGGLATNSLIQSRTSSAQVRVLKHRSAVGIRSLMVDQNASWFWLEQRRTKR
jgi:hypothetical protein